jgi:3-deoxy-D-manno-octulosonate 8-phosphate phosphatase KdsC-like HAD superfamily phosphatase
MRMKTGKKMGTTRMVIISGKKSSMMEKRNSTLKRAKRSMKQTTKTLERRSLFHQSPKRALRTVRRIRP